MDLIFHYFYDALISLLQFFVIRLFHFKISYERLHVTIIVIIQIKSIFIASHVQFMWVLNSSDKIMPNILLNDDQKIFTNYELKGNPVLYWVYIYIYIYVYIYHRWYRNNPK